MSGLEPVIQILTALHWTDEQIAALGDGTIGLGTRILALVLEFDSLISQGLADTVTRPAAAHHILRCCPTAQASLYEGVGHSPFLEEPDRFNRVLREFAGSPVR